MIQNPIWSIIRVFRRKLIFLEAPFLTDHYMASYTRYLQKCGMDIADYDRRGYIAPSVWFDSSERYSLIKIGRGITLSRDVMLLTHDYSIRNAMNAFEENDENLKYKFLKPITIGNNCFIGARTIVLPGTHIGDDVIIGAGSVIKGEIPSKTIWGELRLVSFRLWTSFIGSTSKSKTLRLSKAIKWRKRNRLECFRFFLPWDMGVLNISL